MMHDYTKNRVPQAQRDTAFHFLISKRLLAFLMADDDDVETVEASAAGTMLTSVLTEAMIASQYTAITKILGVQFLQLYIKTS